MAARSRALPERTAHAGTDVHSDPPGTIFYDRWNQLDINIKKNIRHNNHVLTFQIDIFNVLNANAIRGATNSVGASLGNATTIMTGRFPRLAVNYKF